MTDIEVQVEVQPNSPEQHSFGGLQEDMSGERDSDCRESLNTGQGGQILMLFPSYFENIDVSFKKNLYYSI